MLNSDTYWEKIEKCTDNNVSDFIRDYLSIRQKIIPARGTIYKAFKNYAVSLPIDALLTDLLQYARFFEKLLTCKSGLKEKN